MQDSRDGKVYKFDLSILVVSFNTRDLLFKCIQSVLNYAGHYAIEIIVVDNNSSDNTLELVKRSFPGVKFIRNRFNYGFAVGMNQAFEVSEGKYVMTFNPDAEIFDDSVDAAVTFLNENEDVGLLGMLTEDTSGEIEIPYHDFKLLERMEILKWISPKKLEAEVTNNEVKEVSWIWGTSIFARREALGETFFIEDNFLFWEEYWLCKKMKSQGLKIKILLKNKMLHHISASFKSNPERLEIIRVLSDVNGHSAKINEFGRLKTYLSYIVKILDHFCMYIGLSVFSLIKKSNKDQRYISIINQKAHLKAFVNLLFKGDNYQKKYQKLAIYKLNNGKFPVYPPLTDN